MSTTDSMKVMVVLGTRPEGIKLAPVIRTLQDRANREPRGLPVHVQVCVTGQHRQMLDQVMDLFGIKPDIDLNLMQTGQTPSEVAARVLLALEPILQAERPDWILVQGDTTTVMAAAIAANYLQIRVGHVEAGLRTGDRFNPFPEEMNRVLTSHVSDLHFAPTEWARQNLLCEGIADCHIHVTGNTVIDALRDIAARPVPSVISDLVEKNKRMILVTAHRRENFGQPLRHICHAIKTLAKRRPEFQFIYPVHLNPNVRWPVHEALEDVPGIRLLPPVDYLSLVHLIRASHIVLTDSGGIQEEAPSLGKPVLVLREVTERPEAVEAGVARLVGTDPNRIVYETERLLDDADVYAAMAQAVNPYGDGRASERIGNALILAHSRISNPT